MGHNLPTSANTKQAIQTVPTVCMKGLRSNGGGDYQLNTLSTSQWAGEECGQEVP